MTCKLLLSIFLCVINTCCWNGSPLPMYDSRFKTPHWHLTEQGQRYVALTLAVSPIDADGTDVLQLDKFVMVDFPEVDGCVQTPDCNCQTWTRVPLEPYQNMALFTFRCFPKHGNGQVTMTYHGHNQLMIAPSSLSCDFDQNVRDFTCKIMLIDYAWT